jgi:hypothetical protein
MLASDVNNPEFSGTIPNPDALLHVEFYWHEPLLQFKSAEAKKEIRGPRIPYVRIMRPGDNTSILQTPVRDDIKARFPRQWLAWQMKEGMIEGAGEDAPGWKIEEWSAITLDQKHELKYLRFYTVEQLAGASDAQLQRLGIGGIGLREQARKAVKEKNASEYIAELKRKDEEMASLRRQMDAMTEKMSQLASMMPIKFTDPDQKTLTLPKKEK